MPKGAAAGHDYVLIARAVTAQRPFGALVDDLIKALSRLGLYRSDSAPDSPDRKENNS